MRNYYKKIINNILRIAVFFFCMMLVGCSANIYKPRTQNYTKNNLYHTAYILEELYMAYSNNYIINEAKTLHSLIKSARRILSGSAAYGVNIRVGRHSYTDIGAFLRAIEQAESIASNPKTTDTESLQAYNKLRLDITSFKDAIIDPYNRYRPYLSTISHGKDIPQMRHLRGIWLATVLNIDWPSLPARGTTAEHVDMQKSELRQRFIEAYNLGFNAMIFQVSPTADAMFASTLVPWSPWLTGETNFIGELLDSTGNPFDPLQYAVELARQHNMELHAWLNPYRITHSLTSYQRGDGITLSTTGKTVQSLADIRSEHKQIPNNVFNTLGEYIFLGEGRYVLDPGVPAARAWIVERVTEILQNYDIDAIHFDDYFYPTNWNDDLTFSRYSPSGTNRENWRRENTEQLIKDVAAAIKETSPWVKFGISPGGVWVSGDGSTGTNGGGFTEATGSLSTTSWSNFHSSFADTRRWVIENLIDYLTPQVYWDWTLAAAPYGVVADWWGRLVYDYGPSGSMRNSIGEYTSTQIFIGTGLYRMVESPTPKWRNGISYEYEGMRTFLRQEHYNLGNPNISGSMIFSHNHIRPNRENGMWETMLALREGAWRYPAIIPAMPHLGGIAPAAPQNVSISDNILSFIDGEQSNNPLNATRYFIIFRQATKEIDMQNPANIFAIIQATNSDGIYSIALDKSGYYYGVVALNRLHDMSKLTEVTVNKNG